MFAWSGLITSEFRSQSHTFWTRAGGNHGKHTIRDGNRHDDPEQTLRSGRDSDTLGPDTSCASLRDDDEADGADREVIAEIPHEHEG